MGIGEKIKDTLTYLGMYQVLQLHISNQCQCHRHSSILIDIVVSIHTLSPNVDSFRRHSMHHLELKSMNDTVNVIIQGRPLAKPIGLGTVKKIVSYY
jgi:hypothetical protein